MYTHKREENVQNNNKTQWCSNTQARNLELEILSVIRRCVGDIL